jgi:hypothetical protein
MSNRPEWSDWILQKNSEFKADLAKSSDTVTPPSKDSLEKDDGSGKQHPDYWGKKVDVPADKVLSPDEAKEAEYHPRHHYDYVRDTNTGKVHKKILAGPHIGKYIRQDSLNEE